MTNISTILKTKLNFLTLLTAMCHIICEDPVKDLAVILRFWLIRS